MQSLGSKIKSWAAKGLYLFTPRGLRRAVINLMLQAEESSSPQEAVRALLGINDQVGFAIDYQSKRWGDGVHVKHKFMDGIHSFFIERIPPNSVVIDLGCGQGTISDAIATGTGSTVLGIDIDSAQISFAKAHYTNPHLKYMVGDVIKDIPPGKHFDIIVLSSVLEHLENRPMFLRKLIERFHPAKILIRVPTFEQHYFKALKRELGLFAYVDPTHMTEYSPQSFAEEMAAAGLAIKHSEIRWGDIWAECIPNGKDSIAEK